MGEIGLVSLFLFTSMSHFGITFMQWPFISIYIAFCFKTTCGQSLDLTRAEPFRALNSSIK